MVEEHVATAKDGVRLRLDDTGVEPRPNESVRGRAAVQRPLPLNSRRLTAQVLRQLVGGLGVPSSASQGDLLSMIEGKLLDAGRDPLRTQVALYPEGRGIHIHLLDEMGTFEEIKPSEPEDPPPEDNLSSEESDVGPAVVGELRAEIEQLKKEMEAQKNRVRQLCKLNCEQLAEMYSSLLQKEEEISRLKAEVAHCRGVSLALNLTPLRTLSPSWPETRHCGEVVLV